ncbi:hypothetical protein I302_108344 [Kwoniella bestiolae CBS 10118]|uniref:RRM domain-containing protein n=1 Tax=Kwoniella bestiolae CBS 10118 TaxID=1296100 RepID=A0A1B9FVZ1_9TREE|nr:hypothetical protein I302_07283 [Kwoniella bestiolae CBS 10118]OCF22933.1 hypothetical protein I302_07283 [Kwoniella bestiolae CBS 10118]
MAFNYSNNPYQSTSSAASRSFNAPASSSAAVTSQARQVLFSGLPVDISEKDLRELLLSDPLRLSPITTSVTCFSGPDGRFCGIALVYVGNAADAEKIRVNYSGQQIDGTYTMSVQHILPANQSLTALSPSVPSTSVPRPTNPPKAPKNKTNGAPAKVDEKPAGLKLLARLSKPAQAKDKQLALLEKQKANLAKSGASGSALLSRLQGSPSGHASAKTKGKAAKLSTGNAKVGRAKVKAAGKDAMDVDKPVNKAAKKEKPKPKTQAELDEEMRAYERARRFA